MSMRRRFVVGLIAALICGIALAGPLPASARDPASMSAAEITLLQRRLADAGCYQGEADGQTSDALTEAEKKCPTQEPILRIEVGMHTARINRFGIDAACRIMATGSDDETVRLWSLPEGRLIGTLRLPIGNGHGGKVYVTAVSPDGRLVAAGGADASYAKTGRHGVYVLDRSTQTLRRFGAFESRIYALAFSPDGSRLAVGLGGKVGIQVLAVNDGRELAIDRDYGDRTYGLAFASDGSLLVSSFDGFLRRYDKDLKLAAKVKAPDGSRPFHLAIDPGGRRLAVGYYDTPAVSLVDAVTLKPVAEGQTADIANGNLFSVAWSSDGRRLFAAGTAWKDRRYVVRRFDADGKSVDPGLPLADNTILGLYSCGQAMAFAAGDPAFGLIGADGKVTTLQGPRSFDARNKLGDAFTVAADGRRLRFGLGLGGTEPVTFDLASASLIDAPQAESGLVPPKTSGLKIEDWKDNTTPKLDGKTLALQTYEMSHSVAIRSDRSGFVLGADWSLRSFGADGAQRWQVSVPGTAWGVNLARGGNLIVAAHDDGTIRWYRWSDGKELLALFVERPTRKWVAWTPSGYYQASAGGEDLIGWHVNRGWTQRADFFPAARFRDRYARPDIVQKVLVTLDEAKAVAEADAEAKRKPETQPIEAQLPPVIEIRAPAPGASFSEPKVTLDYELRSPSGLPVTAIEVLIDGRPADATRGVGRVDRALAPGRGSLTLNLPERSLEVALIARAGDKAGEPARLRLAYAGKAPDPAAVLKPKLYVLAVGVSDYAEPSLRLDLAAKDATDFAAAMKAQEGGLYGKVEVQVIRDRDATRTSVIEGLEWLEKQVTSRDIGVLFLGGHGLVDPSGLFWYLPADATPEKIRTRGVSRDDLRGSLTRIAGKVVMFLDACHAASAGSSPGEKTRGAIDVNGVINDFTSSETGLVVFGASTGRQLSIENVAWGNGAFTKALVEGIRDGKADLLKRGVITLSELDAYVAERVKQLTEGRQHPVMTRPATITNFPIAVVR